VIPAASFYGIHLAGINFSDVAAAASERLLYGAVAGTLLAIAVWFLLELFPKRDSRTSFVVWFSTLLATAILPFLKFSSSTSAVSEPHAVVTVSTSWAWYGFLAWAVIAVAGLARVALATLQVRKLRMQATPIDMQCLSVELQTLIQESHRSRAVTLMVSKQIEVPTAIGFSRPAIILPAWLLESTPAEELKYILLHELAHLARRDDWTNLAQKVLKAVFFFLPSVWWIERKLSLDREMACDDAVLAQSGTPRGYAECLARVAEKSFLRRQLAMAQAAVGRVRQLTTRVAMILDPDRPRATQMWKPAIPVVIVLAGLSALPASFTPELVNFSSTPSTHALTAQSGAATDVQIAEPSAKPILAHAGSREVSPAVHAVSVSLKMENGRAVPIKARNEVAKKAVRKNFARKNPELIQKAGMPVTLAATAIQSPMLPQQEYVTVREELVVMVTQQMPSGEQQSWQMHVVQVSVQPQAKPVLKPRKI
jgi:beta-lactamase regulating signal transducer with metallopeptidase domain